MKGIQITRPVIVFTFLKVDQSDLRMAESSEPRKDSRGYDAVKSDGPDDRNVDISQLKSIPEKTLFGGTRFVCCPWRKFNRPNVKNLLTWKYFTPNNSNIPDDEALDKVLKVNEVDMTKLSNPPKDKIQVTWIGHATVLVQFDGISVLSDPVFLDYCGPSRLTAYRRYRKAACEVKDILKLDAVIISHNHYDHLETWAVKEIAAKFPHVRWFVTLEQKGWLCSKGVEEDRISELDWWEEENIELNGKNFKFACTPTQHWCARGPPLDQCKSLWCSWVVKGPTKSYYFVGDTGYYEELFRAIGRKYGPFDLTAIPIGAYEPRWILEFQHVDPSEAVKIHQDVKSRCSIGIHWGTFKTSACEFFVEPPQKVEELMIKQELNPETFISLSHGETWCVGDKRATPPFMFYTRTGGKEGNDL